MTTNSDIIDAPQPPAIQENLTASMSQVFLGQPEPMPDPGIRVTTIRKKLCGHCEKAAITKCGGCINTSVDNDNKSAHTVYCNKECQKAAWPKHKDWCVGMQNRKKIYRVGDILQALFYKYRERVFDKDIVKIKERGGRLCVFEGKYDRSFQCPEGSVLQPFPNHLCTKKLDKQALLVYLTCTDIVAFMYDITKYLLSGKAFSFTEPKFKVKNHKRATVLVNVNGVEDQIHGFYHHVIKVQLNPGLEEYVIDLAGAQYGYPNPVTPYIAYKEERGCVTLLNEAPAVFGTFKEEFQRESDESPARSMKRKVPAFNHEASQILLRGTKQWEKEQDLTIRTVLGLSDEKFQEKLQSLVDFVDVKLGTFIKEVTDDPMKLEQMTSISRDARMQARASAPWREPFMGAKHLKPTNAQEMRDVIKSAFAK